MSSQCVPFFVRKTYDEEEVEQLIQVNVSYVNDSEN